MQADLRADDHDDTTGWREDGNRGGTSFWCSRAIPGADDTCTDDGIVLGDPITEGQRAIEIRQIRVPCAGYAGTPGILSGTYLVAFAESPSHSDQGSTAMIGVDVPASGIGVSMPACDVDANGVPVGRLRPGACEMAPQGRVYCATIYERASPSSPAGQCDVLPNTAAWIALDGTLVASPGGVSGDGKYLLGIAPATDGYGYWTATK